MDQTKRHSDFIELEKNINNLLDSFNISDKSIILEFVFKMEVIFVEFQVEKLRNTIDDNFLNFDFKRKLNATKERVYDNFKNIKLTDKHFEKNNSSFMLKGHNAKTLLMEYYEDLHKEYRMKELINNILF
jgi:uncharacterized protein YxjI